MNFEASWLAVAVATAALVVSIFSARRTAQRDRSNLRFGIHSEAGNWQLVNDGPCAAHAVSVVWHGSNTHATLVSESRMEPGAFLEGHVRLLNDSAVIFLEWRDGAGQPVRRLLGVPRNSAGWQGNLFPLSIESIKETRSLTKARWRILLRGITDLNPWKFL